MTENDIKIIYVTDIEGNWAYWQRFLDLAELRPTEASASQPSPPFSLPERTFFVYGGDVFDKGDGDLRLADALIRLKEAYPDRVFLLIGNRDLNKMKLTSELADSDLARPIDDIPPPYWLEPGEATTYRAYLRSLIEKTNEPKNGANDFDRSVYARFNTRLNKLQWLLKCTMGCETTFENRRRELALIQNKSINDISDEAVVDNFLQSVASGEGLVRRYLDCAQLAAVIGNTLFVHGAVSEISLNFVPGAENQDARQKVIKGRELQTSHSIQDWVDELNQWCHKNLEAWKARPEWNADRSDRGGRPFMGYSYFPAMLGRTVMITDFLVDGNPRPLSSATVTLLRKSNISRVVTGHKPFGDSPTVILCDQEIEIVTADQSYSDTSAPDNRGKAVAAVFIEGSPSQNRVRIKAILKGGEAIDNRLPLRPLIPSASQDGDEFIGRHTAVSAKTESADGSNPYALVFWVKARFDPPSSSSAGPEYYLSRGVGRRVEYLRVDSEILRAHLSDPLYDWTRHRFHR